MSASFDNCAVKIAVRELPMRERPENGGSDVIVYHSASSNILIVDERPFVFDYVFSPEISQQKLFDDLIKPLVVKVLQGFSCSALAYGQTGTGKSYTMGLNSNQNFEGENVGVIPRCFREIFNSEDNNKNLQTLQNRVIHASFVEIYNEKVYDLLADNSAEPIFARGCKFTGGTRKKITNLLECCCILNQGNKNRHVRPTKMNSQSSRSHAIFTIHVQTITIERTVSSCLNLVDLAGSEGVRRTGHQGVAMSEGVHINQGLLSIGKVLQALTSGLKVIPYRDSVLSSVLQDSLNPNSYLTLVACISPLREDLSETLSTLRFAQNAKQLRHSPQINTILTEIKKNKVKTPYKSKVLQIRNAATPNINPYYRITTVTKSGITANAGHRHTFCTPSKMKNVNSNKFNQTEMGLTTKEKQKMSAQHQHRHQPAQKNPLSTVSNQIVINRDSLFDRNNDTIESRSSVFSLNISSSTLVDAPSIIPSTNQVISFSPVIRKCLNECEKIMESKMDKIIETLKNVQHTRDLSNYTYGTDITLYANTPVNFEGSVQPMPSLLRQELQHIVKEIFEHSNEAQRSSDKDQIDLTNLTISPKKQNVKCQLFATSSPVFKVPAVPQLECENSLTENFSKLDSRCVDEEATNFFSHDMEATIQNNIVRRSLRLSTRKLNDSILSESSLPKARRQSRHLNTIKEINDKKRHSIRLASIENSLEISMNKSEKPKKSSNKKKKVLDNSVISSYFDTTNWENKSNKNKNIAKHKKAILELLNKGSMKNLQLLPQIGQKTAYQIVTQRTLNGKFKSLAQVEKLPVWRGNAWTRFAEANMLL